MDTKETKKHVNLELSPADFREMGIIFAMCANDGEKRKQFYSRALVIGCKAIEAETNKPKQKAVKK